MKETVVIDTQRCPVLSMVKRDLDLYLIFEDGRELRIGIEARYCDDAWLVVEQYKDGNLEWSQDIY